MGTRHKSKKAICTGLLTWSCQVMPSCGEPILLHR